MMRLAPMVALTAVLAPGGVLAQSEDTKAILDALARLEKRVDGLQLQIDALKPGAAPAALPVSPPPDGRTTESAINAVAPVQQAAPSAAPVTPPVSLLNRASESAAKLKSAEAIETGSTEPLPPLFPASGVRVIMGELNVRSRPTTAASLAMRLEPGMQVRVVARTSDEEWHQVAVGDRVIGFVKTTVLFSNSQ